MRYLFKLELLGNGGNISEAWDSAIEGFKQEPGEPPEDYETEEDEDL